MIETLLVLSSKQNKAHPSPPLVAATPSFLPRKERLTERKEFVLVNVPVSVQVCVCKKLSQVPIRGVLHRAPGFLGRLLPKLLELREGNQGIQVFIQKLCGEWGVGTGPEGLVGEH